MQFERKTRGSSFSSIGRFLIKLAIIIFSIDFFGAGKSNLFKRKTIPINTIAITNNFINNPIILLL